MISAGQWEDTRPSNGNKQLKNAILRQSNHVHVKTPRSNDWMLADSTSALFIPPWTLWVV